MEKLAAAFAVTLGKYVSKEVVVFIISMIPILELRGGLIVSQLLQIPITTAIPLCIIGNIIPIPFILLFIKQIFKWMKKIKIFRGLIEKLENRAMSKSDNIKKYEFWGLVLFVGIPLPGTGAWTGSLIAALLDVDFKKAILAELLGIAIATVIMSFLSYGLLGALLG
ncbi:MAG: small multi-drug export protein [Lachnospiraceae bacterium]|nr:small multi-drug export protein [Lachnospiraceae bacterium]MBD5490475.1 small multi-drug export protein [Lachnospiraceae bacterium]MBD5505133.1 small multi-drug export protein [Lachnospiraceae bacterium]MBD5525596.1 small multi-drug export protein [Lachnospiraceae bacterium]MDE6739718.1 small multi-drug export protein [Lachnospiraceae bacterium]